MSVRCRWPSAMLRGAGVAAAQIAGAVVLGLLVGGATAWWIISLRILAMGAGATRGPR